MRRNDFWTGTQMVYRYKRRTGTQIAAEQKSFLSEPCPEEEDVTDLERRSWNDYDYDVFSLRNHT